MHRINPVVQAALVSGSAASVVSTAALAVNGLRTNASPYAPTNAISHWLWGDRATRQNRPSLKYTLLGYATHHAASVMRALLFESLRRRRRPSTPAARLADAAAVSAIAYFVDYRLVPARLTPGYETRLRPPALLSVYAALALGLAAGAALEDAFVPPRRRLHRASPFE
jgi:hypothetical protein